MHPIKPEMNGRDLSDYKDPTASSCSSNDGRRAAVRFGVRRLRMAETRQGQAATEAVLCRGIQALGLGDRDRRLCRRPRRSLLFELKTEGALVFLVIAFCAVASIAIGRKLARPIVSMSTVMERLAEGDLDVCARRWDDARSRTRRACRGRWKCSGRTRSTGRGWNPRRRRARARRSRARAGGAERAKAAKEQTEAVQRLGVGLKDVAGGD